MQKSTYVGYKNHLLDGMDGLGDGLEGLRGPNQHLSSCLTYIFAYFFWQKKEPNLPAGRQEKNKNHNLLLGVAVLV
ncbi:MAG: hypothetical protein Aureis2KO_01720 [Aureisphaera sp.]